MQRSFSERVLGGVCGGLASALHLNVWWVRVIFVLLALASLGAFAAAYLILWWLAPQQSVVEARRTLPLPFAILILLAAVALWLLNLSGQLVTVNGANLYLPIVAVALAAVFFLRQWGGRSA